MEIGELKKMLKRSTAVLILENGDPSIVVVDYKTYKELLGEGSETPEKPRSMSNHPVPPAPSAQTPGPASTAELELLERINKDILALKEQIEEEEKGLDL